MKAKYALIALLAITFWGCDDNTAGLGLGMFPGSDQNINGKLSTFDVTTESVHAGKMACINFPTVVAALTLYNNVPTGRTESTDSHPSYQTKEQYLAKGKEIYEWGVENLLDKKTGRIADSRHGNGNPAWKAHVYNQATFIGASVLLYKATKEKRYLDNAILAADYTVNEMSAKHNLLPFERGIEQGIYTAIFAEYIAMLVYDCGQTQYIPFLKRNIESGWANRDKTRNVCGGEYEKALPAGAEIDSYSASGIPALMLLFPAEK